MSGAGWIRFGTAVDTAPLGTGRGFLRKVLPLRFGLPVCMGSVSSLARRGAKAFAAAFGLVLAGTTAALAQAAPESAGGEANLKLPDLSQVRFLGTDGHTLLLFGILFC